MTSANGDYLFPSLPAGEYTVTFEAQGLQPVKQVLRPRRRAGEHARRRDGRRRGHGGDRRHRHARDHLAARADGDHLDQAARRRAADRTLRSARSSPCRPACSRTARPRARTPAWATSRSPARPVLREPVPGQRRGGQREPPRPGLRPVHRGRRSRRPPRPTSGVSAEYGRFCGRRGQRPSPSRAATTSPAQLPRPALTNQKWRRRPPLTKIRTDKTITDLRGDPGRPASEGPRSGSSLAGRTFDQTADRSTPSRRPTSAYAIGPATSSATRASSPPRLTPPHSLIGSYMQDRRQARTATPSAPSWTCAASSTARPPRSCRPSTTRASSPTTCFADGPVLEARTSPSSAPARRLDRPHRRHAAPRPLARQRPLSHAPTFCGVCDAREARQQELPRQAAPTSCRPTASARTTSSAATTPSTTSAWPTTTSRAATTGSSAPARSCSGSDIFPGLRRRRLDDHPVQPDPEGQPGDHLQDQLAVRQRQLALQRPPELQRRRALRHQRRQERRGQEGRQGQQDQPAPGGDLRYPRRTATRSSTRSYGQYVAAIANSIADSHLRRPAAPATFQWAYRGPAINTDASGPLLTQNEAIRSPLRLVLQPGRPERLPAADRRRHPGRQHASSGARSTRRTRHRVLARRDRAARQPRHRAGGRHPPRLARTSTRLAPTCDRPGQ